MEASTLNNSNDVCIDQKINSILLRLKQSGENYPNVSKLWKHYINIRLELLEKSLQEAEIFLSGYGNLVGMDIPTSSLILLYLLQNNQQ
tara:strand:+ start:952 stop:1218 length:267 start_codon:yes stop_codon:yes gene_type:complete